MRYDQSAIRDAQRLALAVLTAPKTNVLDQNGRVCEVDNQYYVNPLNVTMPIELVQETPWINTTQVFNFDFSINAPVQVPGVNNNVILGQNNVFAPYAIKLKFGSGANAANRIYRARGITPNDDALYNSLVSIRFEQSTLVDKIQGQSFRDVMTAVNEDYSDTGMVLINPIRIVSGKLGTFTLTINLLNPIAALVISANQFISARLVGCFGQASA